MKKQRTRKLTLARDTVRLLTDLHARDAAGGIGYSNTCPRVCIETYTCGPSLCNSGNCC